MARSNRFTSGGGSSSSDSSQDEQDSGSDYELSLPDDVKSDDSSSSSGGNSSNTVTPTRGSGSGGSSSSGGSRRRTTTGIDRTSRDTTPDDSGGGDSAGGNSSNTVTPTRGSGSGGDEPAGSSGEQAESSSETRRQTTTGVDTSRETSPRDATLDDSRSIGDAKVEGAKEQALRELRADPVSRARGPRFEESGPALFQGERVTEEDLDVTFNDGRANVTLRDDFMRETLRKRVASKNPNLDPEDVTVEETNGGFEARADSSARNSLDVDEDVDPGPVAETVSEVGRFIRRENPQVNAALTGLGVSLRTEQGVDVQGVPIRLPGREDVEAATEGLDEAAAPIDDFIERSVTTIGTPARVAAQKASDRTGIGAIEVAQEGGQIGAREGFKSLNPAAAAATTVRGADIGIRAADVATQEDGAEAVQQGFDVGGAVAEFAVEEGPGIVEETARQEPEKIVAAPFAVGTAAAVGVGTGTSAVRGARAASRGVRRADIGDVTVPTGRSGTTGSRVRNRVPEVAVERNPDAPIVDIQGVEVSEIGSRAASRVRNVPRRAEIAGMRARRDFDEFLTDARFQLSEARARASDAVPSRSDLLPSADPVGAVKRQGQRAELAARRAQRDLDEFTTDVKFTAEEARARARRAPRVAAQRGRIRTERLVRDVDDFTTDVAFTATEAAARAKRVPRTAAERGRIARSRLEREIREFQSDLSFELEQSRFLQDVETGRVEPTQFGRGFQRPGTPNQFLPSLDLNLPTTPGLPSRPSLPETPNLPSSPFIEDVGGARIDPTRPIGLDRPSISRPSISLPDRPTVDLPSPRDLTIRVGRRERPDRVEIDARNLDIEDNTPSVTQADVNDADDLGPAGGDFKSDVDVASGSQFSVARREQRPGVGTDATSRIDELPKTDAPTKRSGVLPPTAPSVDVETAATPTVEAEPMSVSVDAEPAMMEDDVAAPTIPEDDFTGASPGVDVGEIGVAGEETSGVSEGVGRIEAPVADTSQTPGERQAAPPTSVTTPKMDTPPGLRMRAPATGAPSSRPPRVPLPDIDLPSPDPQDRKRRRFDFFERDVIAPVEEDPLSSIDESLKGL